MGQQAGAGLPTPKDIHRQSDNRKNDENSHKIHSSLLHAIGWPVSPPTTRPRIMGPDDPVAVPGNAPGVPSL